MKIKPNYFNTQTAQTHTITRKNGRSYTIREDKLRFFFPDEWLSFYDKLGARQKITFHFLINTGARINEVRNIRVQDVDFGRQSIILRFTKTRNKDGTRKVRVISISSQFTRYLNKLIKDYDLQLGDRFPILSTPAANIGMKKALRETEIKDIENFTVHTVRKTAEVWLLSLNIDSLKVSKHFGHTIAVAEKFYVSPDTFGYEDKQNIREVIGDLYYQ